MGGDGVTEPVKSLPMRLGTKVEPWGEIVAIHSKFRERDYMFVNEHGVVSLIPHELVEPAHQTGPEGE